MNIEEKIFANYSVDKELLIKYGFFKSDSVLVYKKILKEDCMEIQLEYHEKKTANKSSITEINNKSESDNPNLKLRNNTANEVLSKSCEKTVKNNTTATITDTITASTNMNSTDFSFYGKITDINEGSEYTLFRIDENSGYSGVIRQKYINLLTDIREKCCTNLHFKNEQTRQINTFIQSTFNVKPEFLWEKFPSFAAYRENKTKKWFALIGTTRFNTLNNNSKDSSISEIINVKIMPEKLQEKLSIPGIFPAYHMNKKTWISIILNNSLNNKEIEKLITESYLLISPSEKKKNYNQ